MAIYTSKNIEDNEIYTIQELSEMINNNDVHIVFSENTFEYITEFDVRTKGDKKRIILIRNKYLDGSSGQPIQHDPSLKYIYGKEYMHDGMPGLPFEVNKEFKGTLKIQGKAANRNKVSDIDNDGKKMIKTILKNDSEKIYKYWYLKPDVPEEYEEMKQIENDLVNKYAKTRF